MTAGACTRDDFFVSPLFFFFFFFFFFSLPLLRFSPLRHSIMEGRDRKRKSTSGAPSAPSSPPTVNACVGDQWL